MDLEEDIVSSSILESKLNQYERVNNTLKQELIILNQENYELKQKINLMEEKQIVSDQEIFVLKQQIFQQEKKTNEISSLKKELDNKLFQKIEENRNLLERLSNDMIDKESGNINFAMAEKNLAMELAEKNNRLMIIEKTLKDNEETITRQKENENNIINQYQIQLISEQTKRLEWELKFFDLQNIHSSCLSKKGELEERCQQLEELNKNREKQNEELNINLIDENLKKQFEEKEIECKFQDLQKVNIEKQNEIEFLKEKFENLVKDLNDKEKSFDEIKRMLEKEKFELEVSLKEKINENTKLFLQYQSENKTRFIKNKFSLPFEDNIEEKSLRELNEMRLNYTKVKEEATKYKVELELFKNELNQKLPLIELRKKEYDQMLSHYTVLKKKLEQSLHGKTNLEETNKELSLYLENLKKENSVALQNIGYLNSQIKVLLYMNQKLKQIIHHQDPLYDLSQFSEFTLESLATLPEEEQLILDVINSIHVKNMDNIHILSKLSVEIKSSVPKSDYLDLQGKYNLLLSEIKKKDSLIDSLKLQTEKFQNLEALKNLLQKKEEVNDKNFEINMMNANSKREHISDKIEKFIKEIELLKDEIKNFKLQQQKDAQTIAIEAKKKELLDEKVKNLESNLERRMSDILTKNIEIENLKKYLLDSQEKNSSKQNEIKRIEMDNMKLEKKIGLLEQELFQVDSIAKRALEEKNKYFDAFMSAQTEITNLLTSQQLTLSKLKEENNKLQKELIEMKNLHSSFSMDKVHNKIRIENYEISLRQLQKQNELNLQIIEEQSIKLKDWAHKITGLVEKHRLSEEENIFSGFIRLEDEKPLNLEEIQEFMNNQRKNYEETIELLSAKVVGLEQDLSVFEQEKENFLRSEANYEEKIQEIQEKLQISLAKNEIENFESLEVLKKDYENLQKDNENLIKTKNELELKLNRGEEEYEKILRKNKELDEKIAPLEFDLKEIKILSKSYVDKNYLLEISIKEQKELFLRQRTESEKANDDLKKEKSILLDKLEKKKENYENMEKEIIDIPMETEEMEINNETSLKKKISVLELQLQQMHKELLNSRNQAMNSILIKDVNEAGAKMDKMEEEKDNNSNNISLELEEKIKKIIDEKNAYQEKIVNLESQNGEFLKNMEESENKIKNLRKKISELETKISKYQKDMELIIKENDESKNELKKTQELFSSNKIALLLERGKLILEKKFSENKS